MPQTLKHYKDPEKRRLARNRWRNANRNKSLKYAVNKNKHYSKEEVELILAHEMTDFELSKLIGRSIGAIQSKRVKENKKAD